jgi:hypothetical protein
VVAWGDGHLSVIWSSHAGPDNYRFHLRSLAADGTLGEPEKLIKAEYAYRTYQAAMNSHGQVALAWSNGDLYDRVVVRQLDGSWTRYPKVPVLHPTCCGGLQYISNPRALFLDDAGRVSNITWGTVDDSDEAIWLTRPDNSGGWSTELIGPVDGGSTPYGRVPDASFASNTRGDLVATWPQYKLGDWSVHLRFAENGHPLGESTTLSDNCPPDASSPCAGVAIAEDGTSTVAYGRGERGDVAIKMVRRDPDGTFTRAQTLAAGLTWAFDMQLAGNPGGDTIVSLRTYAPVRTAFARCPAGRPCAETLLLGDDPSWLDPWTTSMGADAEVTVTWSEYHHEGIATRQLAAVG